MKKAIHLFTVICLLLVFNLPGSAQRSGKSVLKASIANISSGIISKDIILNSGLINCSDKKYEVIYFSLSVLHRNGDLVVYNGRGNTLSEAMKAEIRALEPGSKLVLEDIGAKSAEDKFITLPSIVLLLK